MVVCVCCVCMVYVLCVVRCICEGIWSVECVECDVYDGE